MQRPRHEQSQSRYGWFWLSLFLTTLLVSGCGFHLRGAVELPDSIVSVYLDKSGISRDLYRNLRSGLRSNGVAVVELASPGSTELRIIDETHDRRVLTLTSAGTVRDYELTYRVGFEVKTTAGEILLERQSIAIARSYKYDETNVLGKASEEQLLRTEMAREMASLMLLRLKAVKARSD